ncbi:nuclear transport factor 2 family protein [Actinoplanes sp. NPDC048796]|uniref:nuclear transport factor 2 family protein n=1 Tax=Actinoplanes sp. NPDC048796 TaxID=3155640 RepID=UPI0033E5EBE1
MDNAPARTAPPATDAGDTAHITNLLHRFARLADVGELTELGADLAEDIVWRMAEATWHGRGDVVAGLGRMRELGYAGPASGNRHVVTNVEVYLDGDGEAATAHSYFQLVSPGTPAPITVIGSYADELRRTPDGRWLLADRRVTT